MRVRFAVPSLYAVLVCGSLIAGCSHKHSTPAPIESAGPPCNQPSSDAASIARHYESAPQPNASGPQATFTPRASASPPVKSQYAINSVPAGLCAQVDDSKVGNTPVTVTPAFADQFKTFEIIPNNGASPFVYLTDQTANGNKTVLYNQSADTNGSIEDVVKDSKARNLRSHYNSMRFSQQTRHRPTTWIGRPAFSTTRVEVQYKVASLQREGRVAEDLEHTEGVTRSLSIGFQRNGLTARILNVGNNDTAQALSRRLRTHSEVADARPLQLRYTSSSKPFTPNDTNFDNYDQWDMFDIFALNAWGYTHGSSSIQIAVIDTGADNFQNDLAGKLVYGEKIINGTITFGAAAAQDTDGHGTNVTGIAAADTNNATAVAGVGFNTAVQIYKIFPDGTGTSADTGDEAQAIYDAVKHGARVINMSLGGDEGSGFDPVERDAVEYAIRQGVTVVAAAGNERTSTEPNAGVDFPGAYDGVIAVGATSLNDNNSHNPVGAIEYVSSYSNVGPQLAVVAPGGDPNSTTDMGDNPDLLHWIEGLYTTTPFDKSQTCSDQTDCLALFAGTSQATPHVTGAIALLLAKNTNLQPAQIKQILESTADDISDPNQGWGRLNVYRALAAVIGDSTGLPLPAFTNFKAFAYSNSGGTTPAIVDVTFPTGVAVASDGTFRVADIPSASAPYKIGVWADLNGDGVVDAGDFFAASQLCQASAPCDSALNLVPSQVKSGFTLP
jgi:subtilisin family serine protease